MKDLKDELDPKLRLHSRILKQVDNEWDLSYRHLQPKIQKQLIRLKLYNNQKRDDERVGDPLLYYVHQGVLANLYDDKLQAVFTGREEGDEPMAQNLNLLAENDYEEMDMATVAHDWMWDTLSFGRGLILFNDFDTDTLTPIPEVLDPLTVLRDPKAISVNGNRAGNGGARFLYREVQMTRYEMEANPEYVNLDLLKRDGGIDVYSLTYQAEQARMEAQGKSNVNPWDTGLRDNYKYTILQCFTHLDGEKVLIEVANNRRLIIRVHPLDNDRWPIIDRAFSPIAHDWDGVSLWDLVEDKQRFRAEMLNVWGDSAKADAYPMRLYDENKIRKSVDKSFGFNKWIAVNGDPTNAAKNLEKMGPNAAVQAVMEFLQHSAEQAAAMPSVRTGQISGRGGKKTLGEQNLAMSGADKRFGLTAKLWNRSEKSFWQRWYEIYEDNFSDKIHRKVLRVEGSFNPSWKEFQRGDIITKNSLGPDIKIESLSVSEAKKMRTYQQFENYFALAAQDPNTDKIYGLRELGKQFLPSDKVERLIPLTIDERIARDENEKLNDGEHVDVNVELDDHQVHLRTHIFAKDGAEKGRHIAAHNIAMMARKKNPQLYQPPQQTDGKPMQGEGQSPQPSGKPLTKLAPAAPESGTNPTKQ